ncbi:hypothetical protein [Bosea sp. 685]|uniref:hypothetical protein n=1 Tax=Bosea sp. 685 TaxID=3080057 RepID=UPI002892EE58|nr:hypothetical protein [Bosea sp. 685]WNJ92862.1 hypothetical protein RMR04_11435 [Bosea sp. 685]
MLRTSIPVVISLMLSASNSIAQTFQYTLPQAGQEFTQAYGAEKQIRIQVSFRSAIQPVSNDSESDIAMLEAARKSLYTQAQRECSVLSERFNNADCRLGSLNINLNAFVAANNPQPPQLVAIATYLLKPK